MTIFKKKQSIIIFYLCLLGFPVTSEVAAEPRWTSPRHNHQITEQKFNKDKAANNQIQWREFAKDHKRELQHESSDKPKLGKGSKESHNGRREHWQQEKIQPAQQHFTDRHKNNDEYRQEPRKPGKHQQKSQQIEDYKDNTRSRGNANDDRERHRDTPEDSRREERRGHERDRHRTADPVVVKHNRTHRTHRRPKYNLYGRHQHIYYHTPWYNTYYVAPIHYHFHPVGYRVELLPRTHVTIVVGGLPYYYFGGIFYRSYNSGYVVVSAPVGAVVTTLPVGFIAFSLGALTYYFVNDTYYVWDEPREAYMVVEKPEGAEQAIADETAGRLFVYPKEGQSEEQQARDRYECHRWAVTESRVDPTLENETYSNEQRSDYQRAMAACLEGRGYTVK